MPVDSSGHTLTSWIWRVRWSHAFWSWLYIKMSIFWRRMTADVDLNRELFPPIAHACEELVANGWRVTDDMCRTHGIVADDLPPEVPFEVIHFDPFDGRTMCVTAEEKAESERIFREHVESKGG